MPLNKIHRFIAVVGKLWGCSASHLQVIQDILKNGYNNVIVLEDDFCLSGYIDKIKADMKLFLERKYDYDVCLLACMNDCKTVDHDDILRRTYTSWCTTTAGYIISKQGAEKVLPVWTIALDNLKKTNQIHYSCDVSWQVIQKDNKMFQFMDKIGFQRPQIVSGNFSFYMY